MSSKKNGDIRGFFKSAGASSSQTQERSASPASPAPPAPDVFSSPQTPKTPKTAPRIFKRDDEIKGSDESDDSDDSLGSITGALGYRVGPAAHRRDPNVLSTPQAKRIASGIHRSPLTLQPKRHKFDLKALINHSREIERTEESVRRADALLAQTEQESDDSHNSDAENEPKRLDEVANQLLADDDEGGKGDKVRRAFKRSKDDEASSRKHCYFFSQEEPPSSPGKHTFPRKGVSGPWKCLSKSGTRRQAFLMGLPYTFLAKGETLPDELFQWILDEVCTEQNLELRRQYINLAELSEDNAQRLVNDMRLYSLLEVVGGPKYAREHSKFKSTAEVRQEYLKRNWSPLVAFLQLLERIAPSLQISSAISAIQLLLRMSMDPVVASVVREHHMRAIATLVSSLAKSKSQWNTACDAICSYIHENIDDPELKVTALSSIPSSSLHLVDLRRRIAAESLFNKPELGRKPIDRYLSFEMIRNRLDAADFKPTNKADFDFERLRALTTLMDIVIDRANFMVRRDTDKASSARSSTPTPKGKPSMPEVETEVSAKEASAAAEQQFNAEIDILAARVKLIHDRIRDKASRKNVKLSLLGLEKRLKYAVRTKPPPKKDIFALEEMPAAAGDINVPKQRNFMRQWAQKKDASADREQQQQQQQHREDDVLDRASYAATRGRRRGAAKNVPVAVG
ncbi:hypothetical protein RRF57_002567 [Xylaria bambusicola]|uniref:Uncharacterized protein n=1 Tax=Xylaria bambusicola TaxID=326684 RepID=A0AAN7Z1X7_9PEZI